MMGHRGCRLGITYPEITEMQARAIFEAACQVVKEGGSVVPEVMIPLIGTVEELQDQGAIVRRVAEETIKARGVKLEYLVGTMIEIPRAAITAGRVAEVAEFFSFGTNDLTQMTYGYSRDDAGKFLPEYVSRKILPGDPFVSVDQEGVGMLMEWAVKHGRKTRPKLKVGICGEHGGDPASRRVLPPHEPRLRVLLAVPRADRPARGRAGGGAGLGGGERPPVARITGRSTRAGAIRPGPSSFPAPGVRRPGRARILTAERTGGPPCSSRNTCEC